ncbi:hypothetical protein SEA_VERITY_82 [Gordonia phage Verity]|uniref:Uncharacterized protein n=2 Tax=Zitchvirus TaxID=2948963 RepID=A0A514DIY1_9CAUD|nr:hypothetical protein J1775_gp83 [Gordonia phage Zipp]YP_010002920.1 hypothetical protein J1776_gp82 [Gordonia phage Verity]QPO16926.1 hypothetical protein SEA_DELREY21_83 [Gordonia phage Delrey21]QXN74209.1 hypothetical protein SEA_DOCTORFROGGO_83 [Gordonia phage DoctorFroggo]QDH93236.1 hypothetical protein SEA_ZIPP_83 [Gordonia phage Zipp]QDH93568.1 hypothetical protein SEA_VERITY_82 [Gordonia phage Verity]
MKELPANGIPEGAMVVHRVGAIRYLDPESGDPSLCLIVQDADGNEIEDIATALGDSQLVSEYIIAQWRRHNGDTL